MTNVRTILLHKVVSFFRVHIDTSLIMEATEIYHYGLRLFFSNSKF